MESQHALFLNSLVSKTFDQAVEYGVEYARSLARLPDYKRLRGDLYKINEPIELTDYVEELGEEFLVKWAECIPALVIEPMLWLCAPHMNFPSLTSQTGLTICHGSLEKGVKVWSQ